jgi:hypothetical protein
MAKSPVAVTDATLRAVVRWLVSVTVEATLVVPTVRVEKLTVTGEIVTGADPVPVRPIVCGVFEALSINDNAPVRAPVAVGENVTPTLHVAEAARLVPQVLLAIAKSPVAAMFVKVSAVF